jgi:hypothetical protein
MEANMRVFWSFVLASGLVLVGVDVVESQRPQPPLTDASSALSLSMEDGTGFPNPNGPPPPPPPQ